MFRQTKIGDALVKYDYDPTRVRYEDLPTIFDLCPYCFGSGKLKAMQMAIHNGDSVRVEDTRKKCNHCNGTGRKK